MDTNLVVEGVKFMILGMGSVFLFLTIMIVFMNVMSAVIHKFFSEPIPTIPVISEAENQVIDNKKIIAAITAAIMYHRKG